MSTRVEVRRVRALARAVPARFPFRFGNATMTDFAVAYVVADVRVDARDVRGIGASVLSPMWFDKHPGRGFGEKNERLLRSLACALESYVQHESADPWTLHRSCESRAHDRLARDGIDSLTASFGVAMLDGAVVDAVCRSREVTLHRALQADLLGFGALPELPDESLSELHVRHTVGLGDPLDAAELDASLDDGLPESLDQVTAAYGHRYYKLKVDGDLERDLARLARISEVVGPSVAVRFTLDGNEQFTDMAAVEALVAGLGAGERTRALLERTLWIEQPLPRDRSLEPGVLGPVPGLPVILDEADATDGVVSNALALGYAGISAKNCKGIFRTLHSFRAIHEQRAGGRDCVLSGEDLTSPAVLPFHQDTCVMAALGVTHVERNAHHYARGLAHLTDGERARALREFPSLYERSDDLVTLRIRDGRIDVSELVATGYGGAFEPDLDALEPIELPGPDA